MKQISFFLSLICLSSCGRDSPSTTEFSPTLFALTNIPDTRCADHFYYDQNGYFTDSTKKKMFTRLDPLFKSRYLLPVFECDSDYLKEYMVAHFISIQEKVKGYTPILVELSGDDYGSIHYILLDKNNFPVSGLLVHGGPCAGLLFETDTSYMECPVRHSFFRGDVIDSYELHVLHSTGSIPRPDIVDSICWRSTVGEDGHIETKQTDSVRYKTLSLKEHAAGAITSPR
jgi:hypothetical protein